MEWSVTFCTPVSSSLFVTVSRGLVRVCQKSNAAAAAGYANSFSTLPWVPAFEFQAVRKVLDLRLGKSHDQYNLLVS